MGGAQVLLLVVRVLGKRKRLNSDPTVSVIDDRRKKVVAPDGFDPSDLWPIAQVAAFFATVRELPTTVLRCQGICEPQRSKEIC